MWGEIAMQGPHHVAKKSTKVKACASSSMRNAAAEIPAWTCFTIWLGLVWSGKERNNSNNRNTEEEAAGGSA